MTFDATVNPVVYEGGVPVFIDTEYDTWNIECVEYRARRDGDLQQVIAD